MQRTQEPHEGDECEHDANEPEIARRCIDQRTRKSRTGNDGHEGA